MSCCLRPNRAADLLGASRAAPDTDTAWNLTSWRNRIASLRDRRIGSRHGPPVCAKRRRLSSPAAAADMAVTAAAAAVLLLLSLLWYELAL